MIELSLCKTGSAIAQDSRSRFVTLQAYRAFHPWLAGILAEQLAQENLFFLSTIHTMNETGDRKGFDRLWIYEDHVSRCILVVEGCWVYYVSFDSKLPSDEVYSALLHKIEAAVEQEKSSGLTRGSP